ncbi:MAG: hypothetical protein ACP5O4_03150 [bacterium]
MKKIKKQIISKYKIIINLIFVLILNLTIIKAYDIQGNKVVIPDKIISKPIKINNQNIICFFKNHIEILDNDLNSIANINTKVDKVFDSFKIQNYSIIPFLSENLLNLFIIDDSLLNYKIEPLKNFKNLKSVIYKDDFTKELITYSDNKINTFYIDLNIYNKDNIYNIIKIKNKSEKEIGGFKQIKKIYNYFYTYDNYEKLIIFNSNFEVIGKYNLGRAGSELHESKDNKFVLASDKGFYVIDSTDFKIISKQDFSSYPLKLIKISDSQFITMTNNYKLISFNLDNNYNIISNKIDLFLFEPYEFVNIFYHDGILLNLYDYYNPYAFISTGYTNINLNKNTATIQYIDYDLNNTDLVLILSGSIYLNIDRTQFIKDKNTKKYKNVYNYNTYQFKINPFYIINVNPLSIRYYKLLQSMPINYYASVNIPKDKYYNSFYDTYYFNTFYNLFSYVLINNINLYYFINYPKHTAIFKL